MIGSYTVPGNIKIRPWRNILNFREKGAGDEG